MIVTAWTNGTHSIKGSYGFKITIEDRDKYIKQEWDFIILELEGEIEPFKVNVKKASFWDDTCRELIKFQIRDWLWRNGHAPWPKGEPPKFDMILISGNKFSVEIDKR
ncbi:MAG: hypothetical protein FVQ83_15325 [Chloroflexi bacterium]|nr:hypothetical protein [Chloroflexota bacterium]